MSDVGDAEVLPPGSGFLDAHRNHGESFVFLPHSPLMSGQAERNHLAFSKRVGGALIDRYMVPHPVGRLDQGVVAAFQFIGEALSDEPAANGLPVLRCEASVARYDIAPGHRRARGASADVATPCQARGAAPATQE